MYKYCLFYLQLAYNNAKASLFEEVKKLTEKSLYQLKISENSSGDNKLSQNYLLLIKSLHDDDKLTEIIKLEIEEVATYIQLSLCKIKEINIIVEF